MQAYFYKSDAKHYVCNKTQTLHNKELAAALTTLYILSVLVPSVKLHLQYANAYYESQLVASYTQTRHTINCMIMVDLAACLDRCANCLVRPSTVVHNLVKQMFDD